MSSYKSVVNVSLASIQTIVGHGKNCKKTEENQHFILASWSTCLFIYFVCVCVCGKLWREDVLIDYLMRRREKLEGMQASWVKHEPSSGECVVSVVERDKTNNNIGIYLNGRQSKELESYVILDHLSGATKVMMHSDGYPAPPRSDDSSFDAQRQVPLCHADSNTEQSTASTIHPCQVFQIDSTSNQDRRQSDDVPSIAEQQDKVGPVFCCCCCCCCFIFFTREQRLKWAIFLLKFFSVNVPAGTAGADSICLTSILHTIASSAVNFYWNSTGD